MGFQKKYLFKYISIISYVLKACFNRTKSQVILNTLLNDLRVKILYGSQIPFKCVPDNIIEKLVTQSYDNKSIRKHCLQIDKCLFVSQETLIKFNLNNMQWVLVNIMTSSEFKLPILHYNRIVILNSYNKSECLLTSTNLFNLCNCNNTSQVLKLRIVKPLVDFEPNITKKISISIIKPLSFNENTQKLLDTTLYNYFSILKFVSVGNLLKLDLNKCYSGTEYLLEPPNSSIVYIKIIELEGKNMQSYLYNCKNSFYVSNLHTKLNEVQYLTRTYLPMEKEYAINNLKNMSIVNYNDFVLKTFPDGMEDKGELLVSWIKPFIQENRKGRLSSILI